MTLKKLTDWETGLPVYLDTAKIVSIRRLSAKVYAPLGDDDPPREQGERTRIDTATDMMLVVETPEEILGLPPADN